MVRNCPNHFNGVVLGVLFVGVEREDFPEQAAPVDRFNDGEPTAGPENSGRLLQGGRLKIHRHMVERLAEEHRIESLAPKAKRFGGAGEKGEVFGPGIRRRFPENRRVWIEGNDPAAEGRELPGNHAVTAADVQQAEIGICGDFDEGVFQGVVDVDLHIGFHRCFVGATPVVALVPKTASLKNSRRRKRAGRAGTGVCPYHPEQMDIRSDPPPTRDIVPGRRTCDRRPSYGPLTSCSNVYRANKLSRQ